MFYRPEDGHGLPHNPISAIVAPRPIGWISTRSVDGIDNLAPYSFFNLVAYAPPQVMFASTSAKADQDGTKDSVANIRDTGCFCVNIVGQAMIDAMNASSAALSADVDEFDHAAVTKAEAETQPCPYVSDAAAVLECRLTQIVDLPGAANKVVFGQVTGVRLRDDCVTNGRFDPTRFGLVARLGYQDYCIVRDAFELARP